MSVAVAEDPRLKDYAYWSDLLRGGSPDHERGIAYPGFYRTKDLVGVAIWRNGEGDLVAKVGNGHVVEVDEVWCERIFAWCAHRPVSEDAYRSWCATGKWPEDVSDERSNSANAEPHVVIEETIKDLRAEAVKWLASIGGEITTQEQADKASNFKDRFAELEKEAVEAHRLAKKPHLDAGREVDATWKPIAAEGDAAKRWAAGLSEAFLKAQRARALAEAAKKAEAGGSVHPTDLKVKAGTRGRGTTLRTYKEFSCTDHAALWAHYRDDERITKHPDVLRAVAKLAEAEITAGKEIPGAAIINEQRAV